MKKLLTAATLAALACGCVTVNKNDGGEADLKMRICKDVIHEKISLEEKPVTAEDNIHCLFGLITWGSAATHIADLAGDANALALVASPVDKAKNGAYAIACDAAKCDQLVATRYKVTTQDYYVYKKLKAEVTGYPAKVTGVEVVPAPCLKGCK
jgi:hypothetical protein